MTTPPAEEAADFGPPAARDFASRHIGIPTAEADELARHAGFGGVSELVDATVPADIRLQHPLRLPEPLSEVALLSRALRLGRKNEIWRSYIGLGYHGTVTPPAIQRNVFENPAWYTQYTPYQAEIAQGRLEALLNYQTAVIDLTGLEIANASLLDEGTAAAEAMMMFRRLHRGPASVFYVAKDCHPQTIEVVRGRAEPIGVEIVVEAPDRFDFGDEGVFGVLLQYPTTDGRVEDYSGLCRRAHDAGVLVACATDLLALTLLRPPGEFGADAAVGNSQRFGVAMGYGGPHAAFFATREAYKRQVPGRIIGVSVDRDGQPALRMALQTREQHIRRDKATSNICTAQVLLAVMAGAYAVYHGAEGLRHIAAAIHGHTRTLASALLAAGYQLSSSSFFDTLRVNLAQDREDVLERAAERRINLRQYDDGSVGVSLDETVTESDVADLLDVFGATPGAVNGSPSIPEFARRQSAFLTHPVFRRYRSETELMRYLHRLSSRDLSLTTSMIPLGSCTMKLNAAAELKPVSWSMFGGLHPFAPVEQAAGYRAVVEELSTWLGEITGLEAVSLQPNSGASGEYAGLLVIRAFHRSRGEDQRTVCLIPDSAHGTNPASAVMAGMEVVVVRCDERGNVDLVDLEEKAGKYADRLGALMITYPSTHGVFETTIRRICELVHTHGGQVYLDGANMNAQVGLCRPGDYGADVCHLNLHKTFSIPHGGGGPGVGPICAAPHLAPYLPGHPLVRTGGAEAIAPVASAPYGSASVLLISWAYIAMMGGAGLRRASEAAIVAANYIAARLDEDFDILYRGPSGSVAHEFILDLRPFKASAGVSEVDVAKRLMDYGYHAPTMSWPVVGTMMIEPTESESREELDRFCEAMRSIRREIREIADGKMDRTSNVLKNAPHPAHVLIRDDWEESYTREKAAFPAPWSRDRKFWPSVARVNDAHGDRNLVCACPPLEAYETPQPVDVTGSR